MSEGANGFFFSKMEDDKEAYDLLDRLVAVADTKSVYGEPVQAGERIIITASEVSVGMGFGFGRGGGAGQSASEPVEAQPDSGYGFGGGGGGGGFSAARPVAVISVGPDGIRVEPIVDPTKIALAFFTMLGSVLVMRRRMGRGK